MELPEQIGIMALPNAVLFPGVLLPLHIFEPRYRKMLEACLEGDRMFAVGLLRKGWDAAGAEAVPYGTAGVGLIRTCIAQPDGSSHLVLQGLARVRIREYLAAHPTLGYPVAHIQPLASQEPEGPIPRAPLVGVVKKLLRARARLGAKLPKAVLDSLLSLENTDRFTDAVSYTLVENSYDKQALLEMLDVDARFSKLLGLLQKQIGQCELWKTLQGKLPNQHVGHN